MERSRAKERMKKATMNKTKQAEQCEDGFFGNDFHVFAHENTRALTAIFYYETEICVGH